MKKAMEWAMEFKAVHGLYLASFVWVYLLLDLVWLHQGAASIPLLWIGVGLSVILALFQLLLVRDDFLPKLGFRSKTVFHLLACYALLLGCALGLNWLPSGATLPNLALFTGVFVVVYAALYLAWSIYYKVLDGQLNAQLAHYKQSL